MGIRQAMRTPHIWVGLLTLVCFLLGSAGWLSWLYHLTELTSPSSVDWLTMVVGYLMQAVGVCAFVAVARTQSPTSTRRWVVLAIVGYVVCAAGAALAAGLAPTLACGYLANVLCGFVQGYYVNRLADCVETGHRGRVFGCAYAGTTLVGWLMSLAPNGALTRGPASVAVCALMALCALFLVGASPAVAEQGEEAQASDSAAHAASVASQGPDGKRPLIMLVCATIVVISVTKGMGFGFPTTDILEGVSLELSRLLYGAGLLIAGFVTDKSRRYGALCCGAALVMPFLLLSLSGATAPATVLWALDYLLFGFFSVFRIVLMADVSAELRMPRFAGLGLLFGRVGDALGTALYLALAGSSLVLIAVASAFFACSVALIFVLFQKLYGTQEQHGPSERELFELVATRHGLSSRERDVLRLVLEGRTNSEIAGELFVSEATVKFHVRNLLRKTGCKNRREVVSLYVAGTQTLATSQG